MESIKEIVNSELYSAVKQHTTENHVEEINFNETICNSQVGESRNLSSNYR